uniref:Transposase (putative) gypsy type domain-containing protein n=1 Tax=Oryza brachyantha TaxID=4533 RepID=J3MDT2_ORYBR
MTHDSTRRLGSLLSSSRVVSRAQTGLPEKFMSMVQGQDVVRCGEAHMAPEFPNKAIFVVSFALVGLVPPFSPFFYDVLHFYGIQMLHLGPNSIFILAIFAHLCEMFVRVMSMLPLFRHFFMLCQLKAPATSGGCALQLRSQRSADFIPLSLRKKWDNWKADWFYTRLPNYPRL